jgi:hypothetical protein
MNKEGETLDMSIIRTFEEHNMGKVILTVQNRDGFDIWEIKKKEMVEVKCSDCEGATCLRCGGDGVLGEVENPEIKGVYCPKCKNASLCLDLLECPICDTSLIGINVSDVVSETKSKVKQAIEAKIKAHDEGDCNYNDLTELLKELDLE